MVQAANLNVLIVEDEPDVADILRFTLEEVGIEANLAVNGQDAIEYLSNTCPNIILLDLNLPQINGWKVLEYAKGKYGKENINVIVITANTDEVNRLVGKMQDVTNYITKPFTPQNILDAIHSIVELD